MKYIHTRNFYKNRKCSQLKAVYLFTYIQESVNIRYCILIYIIVLTCICHYQILEAMFQISTPVNQLLLSYTVKFA